MRLFYTIFNSLTLKHQRHRPLGDLGHLGQHQGQLCQPQESSGASCHGSAYVYGVEKKNLRRDVVDQVVHLNLVSDLTGSRVGSQPFLVHEHGRLWHHQVHHDQDAVLYTIY